MKEKNFDLRTALDTTEQATPAGVGDVFLISVSARQPWVTLTLIAALLLVFLAQLIFGATDFMPAIMRMGALQLDRVLAGEIWRLASGTFLHGGGLHVALNLYVLWSLGSLMERILGGHRFLLLYAASGIAGSFVSILLHSRVSVGASGAIWGVMAAQTLLAWRTRGILPEVFRAEMTRGAGLNLVLNIANSIRPGVDWAAHLGGGAMGGALVALGLLTVGMPRWAEMEPGSTAPLDRVPAWVKLGAGAGGGALGLALAFALATGGVWRLGAEPNLTRVALEGTPWTVEVPDLLAPAPVFEKEGRKEYSFGDLQLDPLKVGVFVTPFDRSQSSEHVDAAYAALAKTLNDSSWTPAGPMADQTVNGRRVLSRRFAMPNGFLLSRAIVVDSDKLLRVDTAWWPDTRPGWQDLAQPILLSVQPE